MNADDGADCSDAENGPVSQADISKLVFNGTPKKYRESAGVLLTKDNLRQDPGSNVCHPEGAQRPRDLAGRTPELGGKIPRFARDDRVPDLGVTGFLTRF